MSHRPSGTSTTTSSSSCSSRPEHVQYYYSEAESPSRSVCCEFPSTVSQSGGGGGGEFVGGARGTNSTKQAQVATQQGTGTRKLDSVTTHQRTTHSSVAVAAPLSDSQLGALPSQLPTRQQQQRNRQPPPKKVFLQVATTCSSSGKSLHTTAHESNPPYPKSWKIHVKVCVARRRKISM